MMLKEIKETVEQLNWLLNIIQINDLYNKEK